jgi:hypothetical protein
MKFECTVPGPLYAKTFSITYKRPNKIECSFLAGLSGLV